MPWTEGLAASASTESSPSFLSDQERKKEREWIEFEGRLCVVSLGGGAVQTFVLLPDPSALETPSVDTAVASSLWFHCVEWSSRSFSLVERPQRSHGL